MSKKLLIGLVALILAFPLYSQTIVSTTPENKKVILEEFTGINCVYCPQGHVIANNIKNNNPDKVFLINVHTGGFATPQAGQPDFRTTFGAALASQSGATGYPAATVNRQVFPGMSQNGAGGTAMGRGYWPNASNQVLNQSSYVNLGVEANIDLQTRVLTVNVEAYYTGNSPVGTNKLNVALLQNNTKGPQVGGGMGNEYPHMHRLVHMLTGQWGVDVNTTTAGSFVDQTFTYTIPADYNGVPVDFYEAELEVVVFMAETTQNIISGNGAYATYSGLQHSNDTAILGVNELLDQCTDKISPVIKIQNTGSDPLTSLQIDYTINGVDTETYNWTGNLTSLLMETIELPELEYSLQSNNTLVVTLPNDDDNSNNAVTLDFDEAVESHYELDLSIKTDAYGNEVRWNIRNEAGQIVQQGGPYGNNQTYNIQITLTDNCYTFNLIDLYGDGGGPVSLKDTNGLVIYSTTGNYGSGESAGFSVTGNPLSINDNNLLSVVMYPNPSSGILNFQTQNNLDVSIYEITGKLVHTTNNVSNGNSINLEGLSPGLYLVKIFDGNNHSTQKLIIK